MANYTTAKKPQIVVGGRKKSKQQLKADQRKLGFILALFVILIALSVGVLVEGVANHINRPNPASITGNALVYGVNHD